jgi:hypothetical protein
MELMNTFMIPSLRTFQQVFKKAKENRQYPRPYLHIEKSPSKTSLSSKGLSIHIVSSSPTESKGRPSNLGHQLLFKVKTIVKL